MRDLLSFVAYFVFVSKYTAGVGAFAVASGVELAGVRSVYFASKREFRLGTGVCSFYHERLLYFSVFSNGGRRRRGHRSKGRAKLNHPTKQRQR